MALVLITLDTLLFTKKSLETIEVSECPRHNTLVQKIDEYISAARVAKDEAIYIPSGIASAISNVLDLGGYRATRILEG